MKGRRLGIALAVVAAIAASATAGTPAHRVTVAMAATCDGAWHTVPSSTFAKDVRDIDVIANTDVWAVGSHTSGQVQTATEHWNGTTWSLVSSPSPGAGENALNSVSAVSTNDVWTVGYYQVAKKSSDAAFKTLAEHWNGSTWTVVPSPNVGTASNTLTGVDSISSTNVWAAGYHYVVGSALRQTLIEHWDGSTWSVTPSPNPGALSNAILALDAVSASNVWAAGYTSDGDGYNPMLLHYDGSSWTPVAVPVTSPQETVLTSVTAASATDAWVSGYQTEGSQMQPYAAHWNGTTWTQVASPAPGSSYAMLHDVEGTATDAWGVGVAYDGAIDTFLSYTTHWDGSSWTTVRSELGNSADKSELFGIEKAPSGDWWAVGRPGDIETLCGNPVGSASFTPHTQSYVASTDPTLPPVGPGAPPPSGWTLGTPEPVVAQDDTAASGLTQGTLTHGSNAADYDGDGHIDLFVNRHLAGPARLYHNDVGHFTETNVGTFKKHDRHGCDWGDVNGDGRLDLFCAAGSDRGTEGKHNELWIQAANHTFSDQAGRYGVIDPFGRGRISRMIDANGDGRPDILVSNFADRADGLPSPNRLYMNVNGDHFVDAPSYGLDTEIGAGSISPGDYDRDGRQDLLLDSADGERLYRNVAGTGYSDQTLANKLAHHPQDVTFADLDGDGSLDVVEATKTTLKVYMRGTKGYAAKYSNSLQSGFALAIGDVNGDNAPDIFLVQAKTGGVNGTDFIYINGGSGTSFTKVAVPSTTLGEADSATAIDYDENGLMDFFVENGNGKADNGPVQLIAFYPSP